MAPVPAFRRIVSRAIQTPPARFALPRPALPAIHAPLRHNGRQASIRLYSSEAADSPQPPEFLTEGERRVFDRIMEGLAPTKLEVRILPLRVSRWPKDCGLWSTPGARHFRWLRLHVRPRYRLRSIQRPADHQTTSLGEQGAGRRDEDLAWCTDEDQGVMTEDCPERNKIMEGH